MSVVKFDATAAIMPGDNFISDIYRVLIETSDGRQRRLIVKCLPTAEFNLKFIEESCLFQKEIDFYTKTLPAMYECENIKTRGKRELLTPICFSIKDDSILLLEDLSALGFRMSDRRRGLDFDECSLSLETLARFHALTVNVKGLDALYPDTLYCGRNFQHASRFVFNGILTLASAVTTWPGYEEIGEKLRKFASNAHDRVVTLFDSKLSPLMVLNHGDFWTNNIMFHRVSPDKPPTSVRFLDFQMCRYGSPALDLLYFLYTSVSEEVRHELRPRIVKLYHEALCREIGHELENFSLEQLNAEMKRNQLYGFVSACLMLPAVLAEPGQDPDFGRLANKSDTGALECQSGKNFRRQFQRILSECQHLL